MENYAQKKSFSKKEDLRNVTKRRRDLIGVFLQLFYEVYVPLAIQIFAVLL